MKPDAIAHTRQGFAGAQEPERIVSRPRPWAAEAALAVLVEQWSTFGELAGSRRKQTESTAKRLRKLLNVKRPLPNRDALEAASLLLELLQALGPPVPRDGDAPIGAGESQLIAHAVAGRLQKREARELTHALWG